MTIIWASLSLDRIMIRNFGESDTQFIALEKGDLDVWNVPSPYLERVKALPNVDVFEVNRLYHRMLRVNEQKPYLSDMRVRQALLYAIDRQALCEELEFRDVYSLGFFHAATGLGG